MSSFTLLIPGKPHGKGRPRFGQGGRVFTDAATERAEGDIVGVWIDAGQPRLEGPIGLIVTLSVERPRGHFTSKGTLSASGLRKPLPDNQKPDSDNALKLTMDSMNTRAWRDDVQVVNALVVRRWGGRAATEIFACELADERERKAFARAAFMTLNTEEEPCPKPS